MYYCRLAASLLVGLATKTVSHLNVASVQDFVFFFKLKERDDMNSINVSQISAVFTYFERKNKYFWEFRHFFPKIS